MTQKKGKLTLYEASVVRTSCQFKFYDLENRIAELTEHQKKNIASDDDLNLLEELKQEQSLLASALKKLFYFTSVTI